MSCKMMSAAAVLVALVSVSLRGQGKDERASMTTACSVGWQSNGENRKQTEFRSQRIIEDPSTRQRWVLQRDLNQPAGPASLRLLPADSTCAETHATGFLSTHSRSRAESLPVIRVGDSLILSEHTSIVDTRLEATSLSTATIGQTVTVRLKFGGAVLHAIAVAPGRATLLSGTLEMKR